MLLQFNFKNYKSFKNETCLEMRATSISEHKDRIFSEANEKALPVVAIYGANAHGKSNVVDAFRYMHFYVLKSLDFGGDVNSKNFGKVAHHNEDFVRPIPFLLDDNTKKSESLFEVYFTKIEGSGEKIYCYGFTINSEGVNEEWLNSKTKTSKKFKKIFYRDKDALELDGIPENSRENIKVALEKETLVVTLGAKLKIQVLKNIRDWFYKNNFVDFGEPFTNFMLSRLMPDGFDDKEVSNNVVKYISAFDDSIVDFIVEKDELDSNEEKDDGYKIFTLHKSETSKGVERLPLVFESSGTKKMLSLYPFLQEILGNGGILVIDELNSRLHPLLVRNFILTFLNHDINKNNAQLIFTTHDIWQLHDKTLRRDEIWFSEKGSDGVSTLYSLYDFYDDDGNKIRKDEDYQKNYLLGKYGAIPRMKDFDMFKEE